VKRPVPYGLLVACALYVALRALVLATNFDAVAMPVYELALSGDLAKLTVEGGSGAPLYEYFDNGGGQVITGLLAVPLYRLLGDGYVVLKLVPFALGLATLVVGWRMLDRHWSRTAANLGALFLALPPPTLLKYTLLAKGNHGESLLFQFVTLALFLRAHSGGLRPRVLFATAVAAGLALTFYFGSGVLLAGLAIAHVGMRGGRAALADMRVVVPGFALGLAPLIWLDVASGGQGHRFLAAKLGVDVAASAGAAGASLLTRLWELFVQILPEAGVFEDLGPVSGRVAGALYLAAFAAAWLALARRWLGRAGPESDGTRFQRWKHAPLVLHLPLFAAFYGVSSFDFDVYAPPVAVGRFRYLVPHFAFAALGLAIVAAGWIEGRRLRVPGLALAAAVLAAGLFSLPIVDWSFARSELAAKYPGYHLHYQANVALTPADDSTDERPTFDLQRAARDVAGLAPVFAKDAYEGMGCRLAQAEEVYAPLDDTSLARIVAPWDAARRIDLARGMGSWLGGRASTNEARVRRMRASVDALLASGDPLAQYAIEGLCIGFAYPLEIQAIGEITRKARLREILPPDAWPAWRRGQGIACGRLLRRGIQSEVGLWLAYARPIPAEECDDFWFGAGWGTADSVADPAWPADVDRWAPVARRRAFFAGYGAALRHVWGEAAIPRWSQRLAPALPAADRKAFEHGLSWPGYPAPLSL
jgi:hypothetical protein